MAGMDGIRYKKHEIQLLPGDELFLYTDGVTEATDLNNQLYGEERLRTDLNSFQGRSCEEKCRLLRKEIDDFTGEAPQFDDITMLSQKYNGPSEWKNNE